MAMFQNLLQLSDIISVVIHHKTDSSVMMATKSSDEQFRSSPIVLAFPALRVERDHWTQTANDLIALVMGKHTSKASDIRLLKIYRIWVPDNHPNNNFFHHIIYHMSIDGKFKFQKCRTISGTTRWMSMKDLDDANAIGQLSSPEIYTLIRMALGNGHVKAKLPSDEIAGGFLRINDDLSKNEDTITEVSDVDVLASLNTNISHIDLLKAAEIDRKEQRMLYRDFLLSCFPYLYMNYISFANNFKQLVPDYTNDDFRSLFRYPKFILLIKQTIQWFVSDLPT